jgi:DNA-binding XRE family transcriptional regulator
MGAMTAQDESSRSRRRARSHLARCRWLAGLTQRELAELAGVGRASIVRAESGASVPSLQTATRIANVLGEPITALFPHLTGRANGGEASAPVVARVDGRTLRAIRAALPPDSGEILADVDHLIEVAEQAAWPL